jgi:Regulator of ribonuclease activity B
MNQGAAENLVIAVNEAGYPVTMKGKVDGCDSWSVESQIERSPLEVTDKFFVESLVRLAAAHQAEFDGWGTLI